MIYDIKESTIKSKKIFLVETQYRMNESLKSFIPSAKWSPEHKSWYVGSRSKKKLEQWVENAQKEFGTAGDIEAEINKFKERYYESKTLQGHTYDFKELLKEKYNAFFYKEAWHVDPDQYEAAQKELDKLNKGRDKKRVMKYDIENASLEDVENIVDKALNNISECEYKYEDDDFFEEFRSGTTIDEDIKEALEKLKEDLSAINFGYAEDQMFSYTISSDIQNYLLKFFGLQRIYSNRADEISV